MSQRLSALFVKRVSEPGKYHDEHGLILRVKPTGSKQWVQRLVVKGRRRDIGLGDIRSSPWPKPEKRHSPIGSWPGLVAIP